MEKKETIVKEFEASMETKKSDVKEASRVTQKDIADAVRQRNEYLKAIKNNTEYFEVQNKYLRAQLEQIQLGLALHEAKEREQALNAKLESDRNEVSTESK